MSTNGLTDKLNLLEIFGVIFLIAMAVFFRFFYGELPCPLCLLQRFGILSLAFGFVLNLRFGFRSSHYGLALIAAVLTGIIAGRQILLHIVPGTGAYGAPFLGMHLYTWNFIIAALFVLFIAFLLLIKREYLTYFTIPATSQTVRYLERIGFYLLFFLTLLNVGSAFLICGFSQCPDEPKVYHRYF